MTTERPGDQSSLVPFSGGLPVEFRAPVARITQFSDNQDTRTALVVLPDQTRAGIAARYNSAGSLLNAFEAGLDINYSFTDFKRNNLTGDQVLRALRRTQEAIASGLFIYPVAAQDLIDKQADAVGDVLGVLRSRTSMSPFYRGREEGEDPKTYADWQEHHREQFAYTQNWAVDVQRSLLEGLGDQLTLGVRILEKGYLIPEMEERVEGSAIEQINRTTLIYMHNMVYDIVRAVSSPSIRIIDFPETHQRLIHQSSQQLHDAVSVVFDHDPRFAISMLTMWRNNLSSYTVLTDPNSARGVGSLEVSDQFVRSIITLVQKIAGDSELQPYLVEIGQLIEDSLRIRTTESENIFQMLVREFPLDKMPSVFIQRLQKLGENQVGDINRQITYLNQTSDDLDQRASLLSLQQHTLIAVIRLALNTTTSQEQFDSLIEKYMDVYLEVKKRDNPDVTFSEIADEVIGEIEIYLEGSERERFSSYSI